MNFECPICNEVGDASGRENGLCMVADCGHVLHRKCIIQWQTRGNQTCPVCRQVCRKICTLYGATPHEPPNTSTKNDDGRGSTGGSVSDDDDMQILYTTLKEDYEVLQKKFKEAREEHRRRDRKSDQKDLEIMRLKAQLTKYEEKIENLETSLAITESLAYAN